MKGLFEAFQPEFESELPSKDKAVLDLSIEDQKKQHGVVKMSQKAMMQLALSFTQVSVMNKLNVEKLRDKDWPTGKVHRVMSDMLIFLDTPFFQTLPTRKKDQRPYFFGMIPMPS